MRFATVLGREEYLTKMTNHHSAEPNAAGSAWGRPWPYANAMIQVSYC